MGFLSVFDAVEPVVKKVLDFIPDPKQKLEAEQALMRSLQDWDSQQNEINKIEAQSPSLFVSGWRPFLGWICGLAFAYHFVAQPVIVFALAANDMPTDVPQMDMGALSTVLMGMLGLGGLRTYEKLKGVARSK